MQDIRGGHCTKRDPSQGRQEWNWTAAPVEPQQSTLHPAIPVVPAAQGPFSEKSNEDVPLLNGGLPRRLEGKEQH